MRKRTALSRQYALFQQRGLDGWLYVHRSALAVFLVVGIGGALLILLLTLAGLVLKADLFDEATVLLAFGTLALAFAALVQAVSGVETTNANFRPNFELMWGFEKPVSQFAKLDGTSAEDQTKREWLVWGPCLTFRNLGPCDARRVSAALTVYSDSSPADEHFEGRAQSGIQTVIERAETPAMKAEGEPISLNVDLMEADFPHPEAVAEVWGQSLFDRPSAIRVYRLKGTWTTDENPPKAAKTGGPSRYLSWRVMDWATWQPWEVDGVDVHPRR